MSFLSSVLTKENAPEILPKVINQPSREVERIIQEYLPVEKRRLEVFRVEIDEELKDLLSQAKLVASENNDQVLLKRVLRNFLREKKPRAAQVKKHTRYVPQSLSREVKLNAQHQCEYVSAQGVRCTQRYHLQIDHIRPWAKNGSGHISNLRCLCRLHNLHLAKREFPEFKPPEKSIAHISRQISGG